MKSKTDVSSNNSAIRTENDVKIKVEEGVDNEPWNHVSPNGIAKRQVDESKYCAWPFTYDASPRRKTNHHLISRSYSDASNPVAKIKRYRHRRSKHYFGNRSDWPQGLKMEAANEISPMKHGIEKLYVDHANLRLENGFANGTISTVYRRDIELDVITAIDAFEMPVAMKANWFYVVTTTTIFDSFWMSMKDYYDLPAENIQRYLIDGDLLTIDPPADTSITTIDECLAKMKARDMHHTVAADNGGGETPPHDNSNAPEESSPRHVLHDPRYNLRKRNASASAIADTTGGGSDHGDSNKRRKVPVKAKPSTKGKGKGKKNTRGGGS